MTVARRCTPCSAERIGCSKSRSSSAPTRTTTSRLDAATQTVAEATKGFLGAETWWSDDRAVCNAVYYWDDLRHLSEFAQAVPHREAKASYDRW
jgi:hypothetical protein